MRRYLLPQEQEQLISRPRCVALGVFDGLHSGHRRVIAAASSRLPDGVCRTVYTFRPETLATKGIAKRLTTVAEQEAMLAAMEVEELLEVDFAAVRQMSPEQFVEDVLYRQLQAVQVSCGYNYRFGKDGVGDTALLTALCEKRGIAVQVVPSVEIDGQPVCSSAVRDALTAGDMPAVRRLLGRNWRLTVPVVEGQHLGHRLGMPTINQPLPADLFCPRFGVYASYVEVAKQVYPAVTNIGVRPTVGTDAPLAETWILGFDGNLYGTAPSVYPLQYLREECRFDSLEALRCQVEKDAACAAALLASPSQSQIKAVLFDFDDTLGERDAAFRYGLEQFIRVYRPTLSEDEVTACREAMFAYNREGYGTPMAYEKLVAHFLKEWGLDIDPHAAYIRLCDGFAEGYTLFDDVLSTLTELRRRGYLLGAVTNGASYPQNRKFDLCSLRSYLDLVVICGDETAQKPDPLVFRLAAARLGVPAESCLFVGDHPQIDIEGAQTAGMQAIRKDAAHPVDHPYYALPPTDAPVIGQIVELLDLLPKME